MMNPQRDELIVLAITEKKLAIGKLEDETQAEERNRRTMTSVQTVLNDLMAAAEAYNISAVCYMSSGKPTLELKRRVEELSPDMLVIGIRGTQSSDKSKKSGKVTEYAIRNIDCPIMVVKNYGTDLL